MKSCLKCTYAEWDKTKTGRMHPSGAGKCKYPYKVPKPPACMYFAGFRAGEPTISGGYISRKEEFKEHCLYWQPGEP